MSNRRKIKGGTGRVTPRGVRPSGGTHGVEVDVKDGVVFFAIYAGEATITVGWPGSDAERVAELIADGARQAREGVERSPVVERGSGLVVARTLPPS